MFGPISTLVLTCIRIIGRLYPRRFRERFGNAVLDEIRADLAEARPRGTWAVTAVAARALLDAAAGVVPEHRPTRSRQAGIRLRAVLDDARTALRALVRFPASSAAAVVVLALAVGVGTAAYTIVDHVMLRELPFDSPDHIVRVLEHNRMTGRTLGSTVAQTFLDWRQQQQAFDYLGATQATSLTLGLADGDATIIRGQRVTWELFAVLRVAPALGRVFTADDEVAGSPRVAIISHSFWQRKFGGAADVVGQPVRLNNEQWTVVGVLPEGVTYPVGSPRPAEVLVPMVFSAAQRLRESGQTYGFAVFARLKNGGTPEQATTQMDQINMAINERHPGWNTLNPGGHTRVVRWQEWMAEPVRPWLLLLSGAVVFVWLIAAANVANLMVVRGTARTREMALRAALGASRARIIWVGVIEGVVLALLAAVLGSALAHVGLIGVAGWMPAEMPMVANIRVDGRIIAAVAAASVCTGVLFSLIPAVSLGHARLTAALRDGGRGATAGASTRRLRDGLVVTEVALAVVLVTAAGLFTASFTRVMGVDLGFDHRGIVTLDITVPFGAGELEQALDRGASLVERALEAVRAVPGVTSAEAVAGGLPLSGGWNRNWVTLPGRGTLRGPDDEIDVRTVSPGYPALMGMRLVRGRNLTDADRRGQPQVILINETAAARYWPGQEALGQRVSVQGADREVVGVLADIRHLGPETPARQECYLPLAQDRIAGAAIVFRPSGQTRSIVDAAKVAIRSVNPSQRQDEGVVNLDSYLTRLVSLRRLQMMVLAAFGVLGLVIAAVGLYGVMTFVVTQRVQEIGVRMALGATPAGVVRLVLARASVLVGAGLFIGVLVMWQLGTSLEALLFGIAPYDVGIAATTVIVLAVTALAATAIPASRAARVDPARTLSGHT